MERVREKQQYAISAPHTHSLPLPLTHPSSLSFSDRRLIHIRLLIHTHLYMSPIAISCYNLSW